MIAMTGTFVLFQRVAERDFARGILAGWRRLEMHNISFHQLFTRGNSWFTVSPVLLSVRPRLRQR
jgi:hypothetical protein